MSSKALVVGLVLLGAASCNCGPDVTIGGTGGSGNGQGGSGNGQGGSGNGQGGAGNGGQAGGGEFNPDSGCAAVTSQATLGKKPVDVIMVVDNSGSMTEEIVGIQNNINTNFANILNTAQLDYRVILIAKHGTASPGQSICITAPLSGNASCTPPPAAPTNTTKFFQYNTEIDSNNALAELTRTFTVAAPGGTAPTGWREWLRAEAFKVIVVITDDNANRNLMTFETALFALPGNQFGTAANRNYRLHSIIGVVAKANAATPYQPTEPAVTTKCTSAVNPGANYQPISIATGGLRFPLCDPTLYNVVFQTIADGVVAGATVACEFTIPPPPMGFTMFNKIIVNYKPMGTGATQSFTKVANLAACGTSNYYIDGNRIVLCPAVCTTVKADDMAKVDVIFTCEPEIN